MKKDTEQIEDDSDVQLDDSDDDEDTNAEA